MERPAGLRDLPALGSWLVLVGELWLPDGSCLLWIRVEDTGTVICVRMLHTESRREWSD